jgi:t-SNARE complex subunit (syntaxin)
VFHDPVATVRKTTVSGIIGFESVVIIAVLVVVVVFRVGQAS